MATIKRTDIYEGGDPFKDIKESLDDILKQENELIKVNKDLQQSYLAINKAVSGEDARKMLEVTKELNNASINLEKTQKVRKTTTEAVTKAELLLRQANAERTKALKDEIKAEQAAKGSVEEMRLRLKKLNEEYNKLSAAERNSTKVGHEKLKQIKELNKELEKIQKTQGRATLGVGKYAEGVVAATKKIAAFAGGMYMLWEVAVDAFNIYKTFTRQLSELKAISGGTQEEMKKLSDQAKALGASTAFTAAQILELDTELAKLGFTANEIYKAVPGIQALAAATGSDLARSAEIAGATLRGFGLDASEAIRVADVMAMSFNKSALSLSDFAESMKYVAPVAASAGVSLEDTTAMLAALADAGIKGSMAGTSLRRILTDMAATGKPAKQALKDLADRGISLTDAFDEVGRTAQTSLMIIANNIDKVNNLGEAFQNATGEADKMAKVMLDNVAGDITIAQSAWEGFILSIEDGNGVINTVSRAVVQSFTQILTSLTDTNNAARILTERLGKGGFFSFQMDPENYKKLGDLVLKLESVRANYGKAADPAKFAQDSALAFKIAMENLQTELDNTAKYRIYQRQYLEDQIELYKQYSEEIKKAEGERIEADKNAAAAAKLKADAEKKSGGAIIQVIEETDEKERELELQQYEWMLKMWEKGAKEEKEIAEELAEFEKKLKEAEWKELEKDQDNYRIYLAERERLDRESYERRKELVEQISSNLADTFTEIATMQDKTIANLLAATANLVADTLRIVLRGLIEELAARAIANIASQRYGAAAANVAGIAALKAAPSIIEGLAANYAQRQTERRNFATGGEVQGPGTGTSDSIPANLSKGEFVVTAERYNKAKGLVQAIHTGKVTDANAKEKIQGFSDARLAGLLEYQNELLSNLGYAYQKNGQIYIVSATGGKTIIN